MKVIKLSHEEFEKLKKQVKELSDEELNKVAGGFEIPDYSNGEKEDLWCEPRCFPILNGCYCDEEW